MVSGSLVVALVHDVFWGDGADERLAAVLVEAARRRAELAVLPELPLDPWIPARREPRDEDAEAPGGPRQARLAAAARSAGIAVLGGAIVRSGGRRANRAILVDAAGRLAATYDKLHLPFEEGYWERAHYEPGREPPAPVGGFELPLGIQVCSDLNRLVGCQLLAARGAAAILAPRATPGETWERWRRVMRASALTCGSWIVSVNRPRPEPGVAIGGPSIVVAPDGHVVHETTEPLSLFVLEARAVDQARGEYPGSLDWPAEVYARGWRELAPDRGELP